MPGRWMNALENVFEIPCIRANKGIFFYVCPHLWPPLLGFWDLKKSIFIGKVILHVLVFSLKESAKKSVKKKQKNQASAKLSVTDNLAFKWKYLLQYFSQNTSCVHNMFQCTDWKSCQCWLCWASRIQIPFFAKCNICMWNVKCCVCGKN